MDFDFPGVVEEAIFRKRINRFVAIIEHNKELKKAHVLSTGRMKELLVPGAGVYVSYVGKEGRKTSYDLIAVVHKGILVSIDSTLPNRLLAKLLEGKKIKEFSSFTNVDAEVAWGKSRLDFYLSNEEEELYLEVKSVTLVEDGLALFPDAPSERAIKHLQELMEIKQRGKRAAVLFLVQRSDALIFSPNWKTAPDFASTLKQAEQAGVEIYAYSCQVNKEGVSLDRSIPVSIKSVYA
ncbi:MAG TPA: DNA/RNA nuclease SfsA [Clostridia bacterium]|jgi:sugar fermentation stimulation protein A|nr:DNA/RNA nuclease SfsA [Clostridia bacterium]